MKEKLKNYGFLVVVAGVIIALDQWTKHLVRNMLPLRGTWSPAEWLTPYARIVHWDNSGVAFGMFQGAGALFLVLALIVSVVIIYYYPRITKDDWLLKVALSMQLAGALGNAIDRVFFNFRVTDFISVGEFPVFNVADSSISVGVCVLLLGVWLQERKLSKDKEQTTEESVQENLADHGETSE